MTCRSPREEDSAFLPATAVVSVLRKPGSTKIFAAVVFAAVAIAITITASGLWDDSTLAAISDNPATLATVIPNVSDVWSALDAVGSIMSSEWLIPPAFAVATATAANQTVTEGDSVTVTFTVTGLSPQFHFYIWGQVPSGPHLALPNTSDDPIVTFPAPQVNEDTTIVIHMTVFDSPTAIGRMSLTILDSTSTVNTRPVVVAGPDLPDATRGQVIQLSGATATDAETATADLIYAWTVVPSGAVTFDDTALLNPEITVADNAPAGPVTLTLTVNDGTVEVSDSKTFTVTVSTNTPPNVVAGPDLPDATRGQVIQLSGATATDAETATADLIYAWTVVPSGAVTFDDTALLNPEITVADNAPAGPVTLTLTVNDGTVEVSDSKTFTVTVSTNTPPNVVAGPDLPDATRGQVIQLSGATATDAETATADLIYAWTVVPSGAVTFDDTALLNPEITVADNAPAGPVTLTLTVNDGTVEVSDSKTFTVTVSTNTPPNVVAGPDLPDATRGQVIQLSGATATDAETATADLIYAWTVVPSGAVTFDDTALLNPEITVADNAPAGPVTLTLTVNDGTVEVSDSKTFTVTVSTNTPPNVVAGPDLSDATRGQVIQLSGATATDAETATADLIYAWTVVPSGAVTFDDTALLNPEITVADNAPAGPVTLTLTVNDGTVEVSDSKTFTVTVSTNTPPNVVAGPDLPDATRGQVIQLSGATATDAETATADLIYAWTVVPSGAVTFDDTALLNPEITVADNAPAGPVTLTLTVNDGTVEVSDSKTFTVTVSTNTPPNVVAGPDLPDATRGQVIQLSGATATDAETATADLIYAWTVVPSGAVTFDDTALLNPEITVADNAPAGPVTLTLTVNDGTVEVSDSKTFTVTVLIVPLNTPPQVNAGPDREVLENRSITLSGSATDINEHYTLSYTWSVASSDIVLDVVDKERLTFTAPGVSTDTEYVFILEVTDGEDPGTDTVTVTVRNVPISVLDALYNPSNGQLTITFNQDIATADYTNIHINGTGSDGIPLSNVTDKSHLGRTITAILSSEQKETYADLTGPYLDIASGAVTDTDGDTIAETPDFDIRVLQKKKSSSSSAPIVDLNTLAQARIVEIPSVISEQVSSHNAADPLEPILRNDTFDFPLTINDYYYLLDDTTNTLTPHGLTAGQSTEIEFTVYTSKDLAHFTLYLNLQGDDTRYASDTYITYTNGGTVTVTDPHGYIAYATITVTEEDNSMPEKKTVRITIEFGEEPMGLTNMVAYMWNTDRKSTIVNLIDAIDVTAAAETRQNSASTDGSSGSAKVNSEPDVSDDDRSDDRNSQSVTKSGIVVIGSNADDAQTLSLIRMWSGFASESITDAELLESMGLDNYPVVHIPDWVMTELGALVSNNDVTVKEFRTALVYMLEMLTA